MLFKKKMSEMSECTQLSPNNVHNIQNPFCSDKRLMRVGEGQTVLCDYMGGGECVCVKGVDTVCERG